MKINVLSVRQPWAWAIIHAGKTIENRSWESHYRGPLAIHASKTIMRESIEYALRLTGRASLPDEAFVTGAVVGVVNMVDCVQNSTSKWFGGPYGFVLKDPRPCRPVVPMSGQLKIFVESVSDPGLIKTYKDVGRPFNQSA